MRADAVSIAEIGYAIDLPEEEWVARVCEAAWAAFGIGVGCTAYIYDASGPDFHVRHVKSTAGVSFQTLELVRGITSALPKELVSRLHESSPPTAMLNQTMGIPVLDYPLPQYTRQLSKDRICDYVGVRAGGSDRRGILLSFPVTAAFQGLARHTRQALDRIAAHLAAAFRLRSLATVDAGPDAASAVLTPEARVEHLGNDRDAHEKKGALIDAVRRMERARGKLRQQDAEQSLAEWRALVRGRWSVVDFVDRDGKRFILARRNEPRGRDLLAITDTERQILEFASLGHSNKLIAYELGLAPSTVTAHVKRGLRKLGVASRAELIGLGALRMKN